MELDSFKEALDDQGIGYRETGRSLAVEFCPECERTKYKVYFRVVGVDEDEPFFGRCLSGSCQQNYSSFTYLKMIGVPTHKNLRIHGKDYMDSLGQLSPTYKRDIVGVNAKEVAVGKVDTDISKFFRVEVVSKHPVAKWAVSRGYVSNFKDIIKIDKKTGAVVFIVRDDNGKVLGYQKRFKTVIGDAPKTQTAENFLTSEHILKFRNQGKPVVVCEGPFTALSAWHWGYEGVSTFGSGVGEKQLKLINDLANGREILIAQENDDAGYVFYKKIVSFFSWENIIPKVILPSKGKDLNDAWQNKSGFIVTNGSDYNPALPEFSL